MNVRSFLLGCTSEGALLLTTRECYFNSTVLDVQRKLFESKFCIRGAWFQDVSFRLKVWEDTEEGYTSTVLKLRLALDGGGSGW